MAPIRRLQEIAGEVAHLQATDRLPTPEMMRHLEDQKDAAIQIVLLSASLQKRHENTTPARQLTEVPANSGLYSFQPRPRQSVTADTPLRQRLGHNSVTEQSRLIAAFTELAVANTKNRELEASLENANAEIYELRSALEQANLEAKVLKTQRDTCKLNLASSWNLAEDSQAHNPAFNVQASRLKRKGTPLDRLGGFPFDKLPKKLKYKIFRYFLQNIPSIAKRLSGRPCCPAIPGSLDDGDRAQVVLRNLGPKLTEDERVVVGNLPSLVGNRVVLDHLQPYITACDTRAIRDLCLVSKDFRARCLFIQSKFKYLSLVVTLKVGDCI